MRPRWGKLSLVLGLASLALYMIYKKSMKKSTIESRDDAELLKKCISTSKRNCINTLPTDIHMAGSSSKFSISSSSVEETSETVLMSIEPLSEEDEQAVLNSQCGLDFGKDLVYHLSFFNFFNITTFNYYKKILILESRN